MEKEYYDIKEAAAEWGISRQAAYQRLKNKVKPELTAIVDGKLSITRAGIDSCIQVDRQAARQVVGKSVNIQSEVERLKTQLAEAQAKTATLQATVDEKQAHIDSLKAALDREQSLHMASLQRLPAGRGPGLFGWLRRKKTE